VTFTDFNQKTKTKTKQIPISSACVFQKLPNKIDHKKAMFLGTGIG